MKNPLARGAMRLNYALRRMLPNFRKEERTVITNARLVRQTTKNGPEMPGVSRTATASPGSHRIDPRLIAINAMELAGNHRTARACLGIWRDAR